MPLEIGLLSSQQDSFEHHEELSKLLNETDVFYVPLRNELPDTNVNSNVDLTKRFDEDLSNRHLIVTFRDIGYSLFLDSVQSLPDETDRSKIRVSGKMIVDGICIQFLGSFDCSEKTQRLSDNSTQQISGVGRIELDENYYRELSSTHVSTENNVKEEQEQLVQPIIMSQTRSTKLKDRTGSATGSKRPVTRSRTFSENVLAKHRTSDSLSPPMTTTTTTTSTVLTSNPTRSHLHSVSRTPYTLDSPRIVNKKHQIPLPVQLTSSDISSSSSSTVKPSLLSSFTEYSLINSTPAGDASMESNVSSHIQQASHPTPFSLSNSVPIPIPSTPTATIPATSVPPYACIIPILQSQSLPNNFPPPTNFAHFTTAAPSLSNNPSSAPFDFASLPPNTSILVITNHHPHSTSQQFPFVTSFGYPSLFPTSSTFPILSSSTAGPNASVPSSRTCNILQPSSSSMSSKRPENDQDKTVVPSVDISKQCEDQLPFKKRRYAAGQQQMHMDIVHDQDDDEVSDESVKK